MQPPPPPTADRSAPPLPVAPPLAPGPLQKATVPSEPGMEHYHTIADTVGGVPNLRPRDNAFQAIVVAITSSLGALLGTLAIVFGLVTGVPPGNWYIGAIVGGIVGLFVGTFLSGLVLMVRGWIRTAEKRR